MKIKFSYKRFFIKYQNNFGRITNTYYMITTKTDIYIYEKNHEVKSLKIMSGIVCSDTLLYDEILDFMRIK